MRIFIIEDEETLCNSIAEGLRLDGYEVDTCFNGAEALLQCQTEEYDLILLDLSLPDLDGMELLHEFRAEDNCTPVLILSARIQLEDKIAGLDEGANDYLTKPFHFEELEARIRSLTRRRFVQENTTLEYAGILFDTTKRTTVINGADIHLTRKETGILEQLLLHPDTYSSQEALISHVWDSNADEFSNSIRVHMSSLRKKLKQSLGYDPIENKIGQGYILKGGPVS